MTVDPPVNTYNVTLVDDYVTITTTVMAMSPEAAEAMGVDQVNEELGTAFPLDRFTVEAVLLDEDVL